MCGYQWNSHVMNWLRQDVKILIMSVVVVCKQFRRNKRFRRSWRVEEAANTYNISFDTNDNI